MSGETRMAWLTAEVHDDHVRRGRRAYVAFLDAQGLNDLASPWERLPESVQTGWLKAAGVSAGDALSGAADRYAKAGMPTGWVDQVRADANDAVCHKLSPLPRFTQ